MKARSGLLALVCAATLSACAGSGTPQLMNLRSASDGPDEFSILPPKGLEMPADLTALPDPTPGGANLTDRDPKGDAIAALGGKPAKAPAAAFAGVPAGDRALLAYAGRFGLVQGIRDLLAAEDLDWRRRHDGRLLERLFDVSVYYKAYRDFQLNQFQELAYWRSRGAATPSAPPPLKGED